MDVLYLLYLVLIISKIISKNILNYVHYGETGASPNIG